VKQIVGGSLGGERAALRTNFGSERPASWFAELYKKDGLRGGHVIMLGPGNEAEALSALRAYPGALQVGGGINAENAMGFLEAGASHVIVTSWVFCEGKLDLERLNQLVKLVGKRRLVLDLSCRKRGEEYFVVTDRWKNITDLTISEETLKRLAEWCDEFLVHAVDVEGLCRGVDLTLLEKLEAWSRTPTTYAGGASSLNDLEEVERLGHGRVDLTIGSALDIFGGSGVKYSDAVAFNKRGPTAWPPEGD
jgi:phosphoribosylformimino-5-aminoimidazole carboxamide ribotide isomerase